MDARSRLAGRRDPRLFATSVDWRVRSAFRDTGRLSTLRAYSPMVVRRLSAA